MPSAQSSIDNAEYVRIAISEGAHTAEEIADKVKGAYNTTNPDKIVGGVKRTLTALKKAGQVTENAGQYYLVDDVVEAVKKLPTVTESVVVSDTDEPRLWNRVTAAQTGIYPAPPAIRDSIGGTLMGVLVDLWDSSNVAISQVFLVQPGNKTQVNVPKNALVTIRVGVCKDATISSEKVTSIVVVMGKDQYEYRMVRPSIVSVILS